MRWKISVKFTYKHFRLYTVHVFVYMSNVFITIGWFECVVVGFVSDGQSFIQQTCISVWTSCSGQSTARSAVLYTGQSGNCITDMYMRISLNYLQCIIDNLVITCMSHTCIIRLPYKWKFCW